MSMKETMKLFIECTVPTRACNMKCDYCYVTQNKWWASKMPDMSLCVDNVKEAFRKTRLGGACMVNICAQGETMLPPQMIEIIKSILENGHYVMVVTNGTLKKRFEEVCSFPEELRKRLFFKFSFHYLELKKQNLFDTYLANINMIHEHGISYTVEITPDDEYVPFIPEIKEWCMTNLGALCHVTVPRDERVEGFPLMTGMTRSEFVNTWKDFDSDLFNFKESIFEVKRNEFCYAGKWSIALNLVTGEYKQCYKGKVLGNFYENMDKPLKYLAVGNNCKEGHCFNGHAFMGFGLIPEVRTTSYADMRNRIRSDGEEWLNEDMKYFMDHPLQEANDEFSETEKIVANLKNTVYTAKCNLKNAVKRMIKHG